MSKNNYKFDIYERVEIMNTCPWDISFGTDTKPFGEVVQGNERCLRLTMGDVFNQINLGNTAFIGEDGFGHHAPIQIVDLEQYKALFRRDATELPKYYNTETYNRLVSMRDRAEFKIALSEELLTYSDKRQFVFEFLNDTDAVANAPNWMIWEIEDYTGMSVS